MRQQQPHLLSLPSQSTHMCIDCSSTETKGAWVGVCPLSHITHLVVFEHLVLCGWREKGTVTQLLSRTSSSPPPKANPLALLMLVLLVVALLPLTPCSTNLMPQSLISWSGHH